MPIPFPPRRYPMWMLALLPIGMFLAGHGLANLAAPTGGRVVVTSHGTRLVTSTRTVERRVHGKVVTHNQKVYIQVPVVIVHTDHHTIRVPQHLLPLRSAAATVANPLVTVYVAVPTTVVVPSDPVTVTSTVTTTQIIPTTITLPLTETNGPDQ